MIIGPSTTIRLAYERLFVTGKGNTLNMRTASAGRSCAHQYETKHLKSNMTNNQNTRVKVPASTMSESVGALSGTPRTNDDVHTLKLVREGYI